MQQGQRIQDGPRGQQGAYCREQPQSVGEVVKVSYHSPTAELLPHALVLSAQQEPIPIPTQYNVAINTSTVVATLSTLVLILCRVCDSVQAFCWYTHTSMKTQGSNRPPIHANPVHAISKKRTHF